MIKRIICMLLLVLLGFGIPSQASAADRFQWIYSNDTTAFKIDSLRLIATQDENWVYFDTWIMWDYNAQGVANWTDVRMKHNLPTKGYENLDYTLRHNIYAVSKNARVMSKTLYYADYAFDGSVLDSSALSSQFEDTIPDSLGETLAFVTFKYALNNNINPTPK